MKHFLKELLKKYGHIWILGYGFIFRGLCIWKKP